MNNGINILAIETATSACSVALNIGDSVFERSEVGNNIHSQCLLSMVEQVLSEAVLSVSEVSAVAVGQGPGSFTGLRIGIGVAQGIAYGIGCPMIGVSSLAALAQMNLSDDYVVTGIDARMNEIYWGVYKVSGGTTQLIGDMNVSSPQAIDLPSLIGLGLDIKNDKISLSGNAWSEYQEQFDLSLFDHLKFNQDSVYPEATAILALAHQAYSDQEFIAPIDFVPQYVRNNVAVKKAN